jgi:energy-coupling factor transporter ATP-binding protein EcfA2
MAGKGPSYRLASVRSLMLAVFRVDTLGRFCQDALAFRPVLHEFSPDHGLNRRVDLVIDYCSHQDLFDELLARIKAEYPRPYARFEADLVDVTTTAGTCPYRGLEPFEAEHARFYFGREAMVEQLLAHLRDTSFVAVVGPSGSGKSSLIRAGLVPALRRGDLSAGQECDVHLFRPGADPLRALCAPLVALLEPGSGEVARLVETRRLADALGEGTIPMADVIARWREGGGRHLLLLVDQFEEVYTECPSESLRRAFITALLAAAAENRVQVVVTLRADFYDRVLRDNRLGQAVGSGQVNVLPMSREELRAAIEKPALQADCVFQPGLVVTILEDVLGEPGALPLLEHALLELWQRRRNGELSLEAYQQIGRVQGAMVRRAEMEYGNLPGDEQVAVRRVLLRLFRPGEEAGDSRRSVTRDQLGESPAVEIVLRRFSTARLLTTGYDPATGTVRVEISHEALIRGWPRMQTWIVEFRDMLRVLHRLAEAAREWQQSDRDGSFLYRGTRLTEAIRILPEEELNELETAFMQASIAARQAERRAHRQRIALRALAVLLAVALLGALAAVAWQVRQASAGWHPVSGFPEDAVLSLAPARRPGAGLYATTANMGVVRSDDGTTWLVAGKAAGLPGVDQPVMDIPGKDVKDVNALAVDELDARRLFAFVRTAGVYRSDDGGRSWQLERAGLEEAVPLQLVARGDRLLAVVVDSRGAALYAAAPGSEWELAGGQRQNPLQQVHTVLLGPGPNGPVYAGASDGVYVSPWGPPWNWTREIELPTVLCLACPPTGGDCLLASYDRSRGEGAIYAWQPAEGQARRLAPFDSQPLALALHPDLASGVADGEARSVETAYYLLLHDGRVLAPETGGTLRDLGSQPGVAFDLLAMPRPDGKGLRLLLAHETGLFEYRGTP